MQLDNYKCSVCDITGVKLWRESSFCLPVDLFCIECGKKNQDLPDWNFNSKYGRTDQLGNLLPAVPTEDGSFWGYSSVPSNDCRWWHQLEPQCKEYREYFVSDEEWNLRIEKEKEDKRKREIWIEHETDITRCDVLVQATSTEKFYLWREFSHRSDLITDWPKINWKEISVGTSSQIGELDNRPVCICVFFADIEGRRVGFYEGISQVVDHKMIEEWLRNKNPEAYRTDAMNFSNAIHHIRRLNEKMAT